MHLRHDDSPDADAMTNPTSPHPPSWWRALLAALAVPVAVTLLAVAPFRIAAYTDGADRALVWVVGDAAALATVASLVADESVFAGDSAPAGDAAPPGCPPDALRLRFEFRRSDEAQVARALLEQHAAAGGAVVCATQHFEINAPEAPAVWVPLWSSLLLPLGLLLAIRVLRDAPRTSRDDGTASVAAVAVALLVVACAPMPGSPGGGLPVPVALALATLPPLVHEAAFRDWLITRSRATFGNAGSGVLSVMASVAATAAFGFPADIAPAAGIAVACTALYLRTGSLAICYALHVALAAVLGVGHG